MKKVIIYLLVMLTAISILSAILAFDIFKVGNVYPILFCIISGGYGGLIYCLRGVYKHVSVQNNWAKEWEIWYYLRPLISSACGAFSYVFLQAGLLILGSESETQNGYYGFYALAFIAGYNVDQFLKKLEELADATWGIKKSRSSVSRDDGDD